jgi:VWFA-related protein
VRRLPYIAALFCLAGSGLAQRSTAIQTESRAVLVDAIVTGKKGEYVRDLTAKDFRVWEDNKQQAIKSFSFEPSAGAEPRYLILFLDSAGMEARDQVLVRQAVSSFIDLNAGPNRMMAVMEYTGALRVAQKFTDNAGRLKDAVKAASFSGASRGAAADLHARDMLRSVGALARSMRTLPGRKTLVLLTGYVSPSADHVNSAEGAIEAANMSGVAIYSIDVRPLSITTSESYDPAKGPASYDGQTQFGTTREQADESATNAQDSAATNQQILFALASGTGGFVIRNSSALLGGLQGIEKEQEYYVLSYTPSESKEGSCHTLRVKVDRAGTTVRARSKYCTVKPLDLLAGTSAGKELESRAAGVQTGSIAASMQLPYFYISPNAARVHVVMDIAPNAVKFGAINLLGIASTADGGVGARFSDAAKLDADKPLHYEKEFKIAPGQYTFTMVIGSGGANFGKLEMPLAVDAWKAGEMALSSLVLSKEVHAATDLGLGLDVSLMEGRTPLIAEGREVVPSSSNRFTKSDPAFFYFEAYEPNSAPATARARVLDRQTGEPKWDSGALTLSSPHQGGNIPVTTLAPGSYRLEVTVGDSKRTADFEIKQNSE